MMKQGEDDEWHFSESCMIITMNLRDIYLQEKWQMNPEHKFQEAKWQEWN